MRRSLWFLLGIETGDDLYDVCSTSELPSAQMKNKRGLGQILSWNQEPLRGDSSCCGRQPHQWALAYCSLTRRCSVCQSPTVQHRFHMAAAHQLREIAEQGHLFSKTSRRRRSSYLQRSMLSGLCLGLSSGAVAGDLQTLVRTASRWSTYT